MDTITYATPGHLDLRVDIPSGDVVVRAVHTAETTVRITGERDPDDVRVTFDDVGDAGHRLDVTYQRRARLRWFGDGRLRVEVDVPIGTALRASTASADVVATGELAGATVKTASGDVALDRVTGDVDVTVASGDLRTGDIGGSLTFNSASGKLTTGHVTGHLIVRTASGDVEVRRAGEHVRCTTVSGDIQLTAVGAGTAVIKSVSGDVEVGVEAGTRVHLDLSSTSGRTGSDLDVRDRPPVGEHAPAGELELRANTVSGDIHVRRAPSAASAA